MAPHEFWYVFGFWFSGFMLGVVVILGCWILSDEKEPAATDDAAEPEEDEEEDESGEGDVDLTKLTAPILCPHCGEQLQSVHWASVPILIGWDTLYTCPLCHKLLGISSDNVC